jgi:hypothetical protein
MIPVLIADDQAPVRGDFRMILEAQADIEITGKADNGRDVLARTRALRQAMDEVRGDSPIAPRPRLAGPSGRPKNRLYGPSSGIFLTGFRCIEVVARTLAFWFHPWWAGKRAKSQPPPLGTLWT